MKLAQRFVCPLARLSERVGVRETNMAGFTIKSGIFAMFVNVALFSIASAGARDLSETVQLHGFASQGAAWTSHNQFGGSTPGSAGVDMRELGLNLSWQAAPDWLVSGQLVSRWAGATDNGTVRVDYAFVDHGLIDNARRHLGVQLGKVKNPYGFFNMTRDVAHTRAGIMLPQSIYQDQIRDFFLAAPGISLHGREESGDNLLSWQVSVLQPQVNSPNLTAYIVDRQLGHFNARTSVLAQTLWEQDGGKWRVGLSLGQFDIRYQPSPGDFFGAGSFTGAGNVTLNTGVLSVEHNREDWSYTAEYASTRQLRSAFNVPFAPILDKDTTIEAYYLQTLWRFAPRWQALARYDAVYLDKQDRSGMNFAAATMLPASQRYARDWTMGLRYEASSNWSLFAELHHVNGGAWLSKLDNPPAGLNSAWDMLLLQAAWHF